MTSAATTYIVTRTHGLRTHLIPPRDIQLLTKAKNIKEVSDSLLKTEYGAEISKLPTKEVDAAALEEIFLKTLVNRFFFVTREAQGKMQDLLVRYCARFEVENIKRIVRAKHGAEMLEERSLIPLPREYTLVNFPALLKAKDVEEVVALLRETPYRPLAQRLEVYRQAGTSLVFEAALDEIYFTKVWEMAQKITKGKGVRDLVGEEIDLRNLLIVLSLKARDLPSSLIEESLVSSTYRLSESRLHSLIQARFEDAPNIVTTRLYSKLASEVVNAARGGSGFPLEIAYLKQLYKDASQALRTYFLDAGYIIGYLLCSECEAKNLVMIVTGKQLSLPEEEISRKLFLD
jgi:vacuolar-type H+-ATPase subunit C/Vma6